MFVQVDVATRNAYGILVSGAGKSHLVNTDKILYLRVEDDLSAVLVFGGEDTYALTITPESYERVLNAVEYLDRDGRLHVT